jgi:uncharacterized protein (TIGR02266 family)
MSDVDHRNENRVVINQEFASLDAFLSVYATNISRSGVFIRSDSPLAVGSRIHFQFSIVADEIRTIAGEGEVVRVVNREEGDEPGMALAFLTLEPDSQELVEQIVGPPASM